MPYRFLGDIATADAAFEAEGQSIEELFMAASDASMNVMVDDLNSIKRLEHLEFELSNPDLDLLLFGYLNEFVYYKDAKRLLLVCDSLEIKEDAGVFRLKAKASGERLEQGRHPLKVDVKAATLHLLRIEKTDSGFKTIVVLDI